MEFKFTAFISLSLDGRRTKGEGEKSLVSRRTLMSTPHPWLLSLKGRGEKNSQR